MLGRKVNAYFAVLLITIVGFVAALLIIHVATMADNLHYRALSDIGTTTLPYLGR